MPILNKGLVGWQIAKMGDVQATQKLSTGELDNISLVLEIPNTAEGSWIGVGQRITVISLQRYRLLANYRLVDDNWSTTKIVLRVSQFDHTGELIKVKELSDPNPLANNLTGDKREPTWNSLAYSFVTDEQTTTVEIGVGIFGKQATIVEIDDLTFKTYPTQVSAIRHDKIALLALLLLISIPGYATSQALWLNRWRVLINTGLVVASLVLTLVVAEIAIRYIPLRLVSLNWPPGYHIPFIEGKSYRLVKNYPPAFVTDSLERRHLVMSNSLGVRDIEVQPLANDQTVVLVLGDSMTFGWGLSDVNDTWPRRINTEISQISPESDRYHFVNAGVSGYNTFQAVFLFQTLIKDMERQKVKPKIALLSFYSKHWSRNQYEPEGVFTSINGLVVTTEAKRQLLNLISYLINQSQFDDLKLIRHDRINFYHETLLSKSRLYFVLSVLTLKHFDNHWDEKPPTQQNIDPVAINYAALKSFKELAEANDIHPIVAFLPSYNFFRSPGQNKYLVENLADVCQNLGLSFINPYENMQTLGINKDNLKEKLTLFRNPHYSIEGNLLYAKALAPLLVDHLTQDYKTDLSLPSQKEFKESR